MDEQSDVQQLLFSLHYIVWRKRYKYGRLGQDGELGRPQKVVYLSWDDRDAYRDAQRHSCSATGHRCGDTHTHTHTHTHTQSACCQSHHSLPVSHVDLVPEKTDLYRRLMEDRKWQEVFSMKISCQSNTSVPPPGTAVCTYVIDVDTFIPFYAACSRPQRFHLVILFKTLQHNLLLCFLAKEGNNGAESTPV